MAHEGAPAKVKGYVAAENKTLKLCAFKQLAYDDLSQIDEDYFALCEYLKQTGPCISVDQQLVILFVLIFLY